MTADARSLWGAEDLWQRLSPMLPGLTVEVHARLESTNSLLLARARASSVLQQGGVDQPDEIKAPRREAPPHGRRAGDIAPCLLVAEQQTRGRGRLGRDWISSAGASLTFSLSVPLSPRQWSGLSLAVGLALAQALDPAPASESQRAAWRPRIGLKWPNDLWLLDAPGRGRKLGGVLIETVGVGDHRLCVIGVGLNVCPLPAGLPAAEGLAHGYACVQELWPEVKGPDVLAKVAEPLVRALRGFELEGLQPLLPAYARRDLLFGLPIVTTLPQALSGIADGIDDDGALRVRGEGLHRVVSGEVSVRLALAD